MELVQARMITDDVAGLAAFYARLTRADVTLNEYYVEVPAGPASIGFSRPRFTEYAACPVRPATVTPRGDRPGVILDFLAADVDAEHPRVAALGACVIMPPATQPWGSRSMIVADPEGNLINVFSRTERL
jgi:predicted enzyme related to lactoylglutathione lyase